jgi:hypothetical protein
VSTYHTLRAVIETRDHVPSLVLLDEPFPENLPVVVSCRSCNEGVSADEEYVACLVECARTGLVAVQDLERAKVRRLLTEKPALAERLADAHLGTGHGARILVETERVRRVVLKLARGHALFELNEPQTDEPSSLFFAPFSSLSRDVMERFEAAPARVFWPEVGSRAMQRMATSSTGTPEWLVVQPGRYRYLAYVDGTVVIRIVLSEYLACEVVWPPDWQPSSAG